MMTQLKPINMKKYIVLIISVFILALQINAQEESRVENSTTRKLSKEQRMALRAAEEAALERMVDSLVKTKRFILEANYLSNQSGVRVTVNNLINFIIVDSSRIVIQFASNSSIGGPNGMGGITTNGRITSYDYKKVGKGKGYYSIRLMTMTSLGMYDIWLNINPSSSTDASISGNTYGKLNYHGVIKPIEMSRAFKGRTI